MHKIMIVCVTVMLLSSCSNLLLALITGPETEEIDPSTIKTILTIERYEGILCSIDGVQVNSWSPTYSEHRFSYDFVAHDGFETRIRAWPDDENADQKVHYTLYNPDSYTRISLGSSRDRPNGVSIEMSKTSLTLIISLISGTVPQNSTI